MFINLKNVPTLDCSQKSKAPKEKYPNCIRIDKEDVSTPSFGSHPNPISIRRGGRGRLCPPYTGVHTKF